MHCRTTILIPLSGDNFKRALRRTLPMQFVSAE